MAPWTNKGHRPARDLQWGEEQEYLCGTGSLQSSSGYVDERGVARHKRRHEGCHCCCMAMSFHACIDARAGRWPSSPGRDFLWLLTVLQLPLCHLSVLLVPRKDSAAAARAGQCWQIYSSCDNPVNCLTSLFMVQPPRHSSSEHEKWSTARAVEFHCC